MKRYSKRLAQSPEPPEPTEVGRKARVPDCDAERAAMSEVSSMTALLMDFYRELKAQFGPRSWWPAETPFEVCVGAILTQNTAWKNVVKAIDNLKAANVLDARTIDTLAQDRLAELIRPAGYFNVKARRLTNFIHHLMVVHDGDLASLFSRSTDDLREELLGINGVGKETADSIILYAAEKPIFVVDAYTRRVLERHGLIDGKADYDTIQELFHRHVPPDVALYNDFHAQIVAVGHYHCSRKPRCDECPLRRFLPLENGLLCRKSP